MEFDDDDDDNYDNDDEADDVMRTRINNGNATNHDGKMMQAMLRGSCRCDVVIQLL